MTGESKKGICMNLCYFVLFCGEPKKVSKSKLSRVVRAIFPSFCQGPFRWMKRTSCGSLHASSWWHAPSTWSGSATDGTGGWDESSQQTAGCCFFLKKPHVGITHEMDKETRTGGLKSMKHWNSFYIVYTGQRFRIFEQHTSVIHLRSVTWSSCGFSSIGTARAELSIARYASFHHTKEPSHPPENLLLFYAGELSGAALGLTTTYPQDIPRIMKFVKSQWISWTIQKDNFIFPILLGISLGCNGI